MKKVAVVFRRLGPYHVARLEGAAAVAAGHGAQVVGIEVARSDGTYAWEPTEGGCGFRRIRLFRDAGYEDIPPRDVQRALVAVLREEAPDGVALPGWGSVEARAGLSWTRESGAAAILMSESARHDFPRLGWREKRKARVVARYQAALVGGSRHAAYVTELGMPAERVFLGYDVVDNGYFDREASRHRQEAERLRQAYDLPPRYFMASGRFVAKKNFGLLLEAYDAYRRDAGDDAWGLVLCGDGPLRRKLLRTIQQRGLGGLVRLPGFVQYAELPIYYGLAGAFVHVSRREQWGLVVNEALACALPVIVSMRCGCVPELVETDVNGWQVDPADADGVARCLARLSDAACDRAVMGRASADRIADWSPQRFGEGLWAAFATAAGDRGEGAP